MSDIVKNAWIGLLSVLAMLAMVNVNAANLTMQAPSGTVNGKALAFSDTPKVGAEGATVMDVKLTAADVGSGGTVTFDAIGIESPNFTLQADDCGATLVAPAFCTLHVKFTPEAAGKRYAELIIRSDAENAVNGAHTVYLQGTAVGKASQTISITAPASIAVGGTGTVSATATSTLPVAFSSSTSSVCTISGSTVTGVGVGTCTIVADQAGNADYNAATQTQNINVTIGTQTISFGPAPTIAVGATGTVSATATSTLPVRFSTATAGTICTVSGSTVTGVGAGTCIVAANQDGNASYSAAQQVTQNVTITAAKSDQTIAFGTAPTVTVGATGTVSATASPSGLPVTFSSTTPSYCTVSGSTVTGVSAGTCTIAANQMGSGSYNAAPTVNQSFTVGAAAGGGGDLCTQYGLTENTELTRAGNTSKTLPIRSTQGYSFSFTTGATGTAGQLRDNYSSVVQYVTVSKNKCDYAATLEPLCAKQGGTPLIYYKVGGTSTYQCILEPNTTYYYNVRDASRDATTKAFTNTCSGSCTFMTF